jgi:hypothetical protein
MIRKVFKSRIIFSPDLSRYLQTDGPFPCFCFAFFVSFQTCSTSRARNYLQALKRQTEGPTRCDIRVQNGCPDWFCLEIGKDACSVSGVCGRQHLRVRHRSLHLLVLTVGSTRNVHPIGSKMHSILASWFVATVAVLTSCLAYVFDWNETHVYNPHWPPHAKFHNAQTLLLGPLLGTVSLFFLWGKHDLGSAVLT